MDPTISIIMPCFNSAKHVHASMASALNQTFRDTELIVVDDGSTDNTASIVGSVDDIRVRFVRQRRQGVSAARNAAIQLARGDFIAFLDSDDTWAPECLEKLHTALRLQPNAVLAYCGWQNVGMPGRRGKPYVPPDYEVPEKLILLFTGCRWPIHAALVRRDSVVAAGGFDTTLANCEDYALWLEIAGRGPIVRVPEVLAFYHFGAENQATRHRARGALHQLRAQLNYLQRHPEFSMSLGPRRRQLLAGSLRRRGFDCYWRRDLDSARVVFRHMLLRGYARRQDLKYLLPAFLPAPVHRLLLRVRERGALRGARSSST